MSDSLEEAGSERLLREACNQGPEGRALRLRMARSFFARLIGLLGSSALLPDEGLWIEPCSSVHTFGMRYDIDVVFLDRSHTIIDVVEHLPPCHCRWRRGAQVAIELAAGTAGLRNIHVGQAWPQGAQR